MIVLSRQPLQDKKLASLPTVIWIANLGNRSRKFFPLDSNKFATFSFKSNWTEINAVQEVHSGYLRILPSSTSTNPSLYATVSPIRTFPLPSVEFKVR